MIITLVPRPISEHNSVDDLLLYAIEYASSSSGNLSCQDCFLYRKGFNPRLTSSYSGTETVGRMGLVK